MTIVPIERELLERVLRYLETSDDLLYNREVDQKIKDTDYIQHLLDTFR